MRLTAIPLILLPALLLLAGGALAQSTEAPCPECDEDGPADDSWYSSIDTGVVSEHGSVLEDTDVSVGENENGTFTWFQYCLQVFDVFGNWLVVTYEVFASDDGVDVDGSVTVNGETVDLEDTPLGGADDATWGRMPDVAVDAPVGHEDLPEPLDVDECVDLSALDVVC